VWRGETFFNSHRFSFLQGKAAKRKSKKLKDADLVSYVPASSIENPDHCGFIDIRFGIEPWNRFWCIAFGNCLYIYQNKAAVSTIKTVVLPGYEIKLGELHDINFPYNLSLYHEGISPVYISVPKQEELQHWAAVLETYTRAEGFKKIRSDNSLAHKSALKTANGGMKGPLKADHSISGMKASDEVYLCMAYFEVCLVSNFMCLKKAYGVLARLILLFVMQGESGVGNVSSSRHVEVYENYQDLIIHRYEKRIRKTHRVANQTEQKLKKQQMSLLHFKKELSRHVVKLQELSSSGDPHAVKRLKSVHTKLLQLEKIVPYLGKYISVNRQAEMQTIAVLKESCTVELQKLSQNMNRTLPTQVSASRDDTDTTWSQAPALSSYNADRTQEDHVDENPYASLTEAKQEADVSRVKLRSNYAQLDFPIMQCGESLRPPSVKYSEVRIGGDLNILSLPSDKKDSLHDATLTEDSDIFSLDATPGEVRYISSSHSPGIRNVLKEPPMPAATESEHVSVLGVSEHCNLSIDNSTYNQVQVSSRQESIVLSKGSQVSQTE
jgi:hypothetical protein